MRYLIVLAVFLAAWFLIDEFILQDRSSEGLTSFPDKLRDLGKRFHLVFGILAVMIVLMLVARALYQWLWSP
jgi:hypothetical protein